MFSEGTRLTSQCVIRIFAPTITTLNPASTTPDQSVPSVDLRAVIFSTRIPKNANRLTMIGDEPGMGVQGRRAERIFARAFLPLAITANPIAMSGTGVTQRATIEYGLSAKIATATSPARMMAQTNAKPKIYELEFLFIAPLNPSPEAY